MREGVRNTAISSPVAFSWDFTPVTTVPATVQHSGVYTVRMIVHVRARNRNRCSENLPARSLSDSLCVWEAGTDRREKQMGGGYGPPPTADRLSSCFLRLAGRGVARPLVLGCGA